MAVCGAANKLRPLLVILLFCDETGQLANTEEEPELNRYSDRPAPLLFRRSLFSQQSRPHHVLAVQVVQHGAEQVRARLVVGFAGVVVQLAAQLIGDQRQQDVPAVCGSRRDGDDGDLTPAYTCQSGLPGAGGRGLLPGCLNRSLSTILHMQPTFWRTSCRSGMLSMNLASRTLRRQKRRAGQLLFDIYIFHLVLQTT